MSNFYRLLYTCVIRMISLTCKLSNDRLKLTNVGESSELYIFFKYIYIELEV